MKLDPEYIVNSISDEVVMVPIGSAAEKFQGIVRLNETAAFLVERMKQSVTPDALVEALLDEYEVDRPTAEQSVTAVIEKLRSIGALVED